MVRWRGPGPGTGARRRSNVGRSLGQLHFQSHLVGTRAAIADEELELPVLRRSELHLAFWAGAGVLAHLLAVLGVDEQMHVRLLCPLRRGSHLLPCWARQEDGDLVLLLEVECLALERSRLAFVARFDIIPTHTA